MMPKPTHAVLLVGSPKGSDSSSNSLGTYLTDRLNEKGIAVERVFLCQAQSSDKNRASLFELIDNSDLVILSFPLYVDSLHSQVIKTLELIAEHEKTKQQPRSKRFAAIANSGFPEAQHSDTALHVCHIFADRVGYIWAGGLAMGGGGMIGGRPISELGSMVRNQTKALNIAAEALAKGEAIPETAITLMGKLGFPKWLYIWMGNRGWKQQAKEHMKPNEMYNQPYSQSKGKKK
jgi:hypothetical protein